MHKQEILRMKNQNMKMCLEMKKDGLLKLYIQMKKLKAKRDMKKNWNLDLLLENSIQIKDLNMMLKHLII